MGPVIGNYDHLIPLFHTAFRIPFGVVSAAHDESPFWKKNGSLDRNIMFDGVKPTEQSVNQQIKKMDMAPEVKISRPDLFERALESTWQQLETVLTQKPNMAPEMNYSSSATFPYTSLGFKDKKDVFSSGWFWEHMAFGKHVPIWRVSPKHEFLSVEEIFKDFKIRTFTVAPCEILYWQKVFTDDADNALALFKPSGIQYGKSFQHGGFHNMILDHGENVMERTFIDADVSGWDRSIWLMDHCWKLRERGLAESLSQSPMLRERFEWCKLHTVKATMLLPNGDLVQRLRGNASGSGSTTGDNCIMHLIIQNYMDLIASQEMGISRDIWSKNIYGDDILKSGLINSQTLLSLFRRVYAEMGLTLKESATHTFVGPIGSTFLGARCVLYRGFFMPSFNKDRIYTAACCIIKKNTMDEEASKVYALMHLAWDDDVLFNALRSALLNYIKNSNGEAGEFLKYLSTNGIPSRTSVLQSWTGLESMEEEAFENLFSKTRSLWKQNNNSLHVTKQNLTSKCCHPLNVQNAIVTTNS